MDRVGQVESQFNWMFVLIAGAVILLAVFSFILRHRASTNREIAETFLEQLDEITTSAGIAKGTARMVDLPPLGVDMLCTKECSCTITAMGTASAGFEDKVLFGPGATEGSIMLWAQEWAVPFRASNFVYVTSKNVKYYIVGTSSPMYDMLREKLPDLMDAEFITTNAMANEEYPGHESVRIVYVDVQPPWTNGAMNLPLSWEGEDVSVVHVTVDTATFYTKTVGWGGDNWQQSVPINYYGDAGLFAAVFAGDVNMFSCGLYKASERLYYISQMYKLRTEELNDPDVCEFGEQYTDAIDVLGDLVDLSASMRDDLSQMQQLPGIIEQLDEYNRRAGSKSCPYIY